MDSHMRHIKPKISFDAMRVQQTKDGVEAMLKAKSRSCLPKLSFPALAVCQEQCRSHWHAYAELRLPEGIRQPPCLVIMRGLSSGMHPCLDGGHLPQGNLSLNYCQK